MAGAPTPPGTGTPPPTDGGARADRPLRRARPPGPTRPVGIGAAVDPGRGPPVQPPHPEAPAAHRSARSTTPSPTPSPRRRRRRPSRSVVYQAVQPSLVLIQTEGDADPDPRPTRTTTASAAASSSTSAGDILTSLHVVDGATAIELTFADGSTSPGRDRRRAARERHRGPPRPRAAGDPRPGHARQPGRGHGRGARPTPSARRSGCTARSRRASSPGSIARSRCRTPGRTLTGLFQIDAAVNPGNSGGALVDRDGRLIGIVTALINPTEDDVFIGIGLAVPIDVAGGAAGLLPY